MGRNSRQTRKLIVEHEGIIQYLVYVVMGLLSTIFAGWNKHITGRIGRVEKKARDNDGSIQKTHMCIHKRFATHEREERDRSDRHAADIAQEFKELRKDVNDGHGTILKEVNALALEIRNGHGKS